MRDDDLFNQLAGIHKKLMVAQSDDDLERCRFWLHETSCTLNLILCDLAGANAARHGQAMERVFGKAA